jgi:hypothetical protein
MDTKVVGFLFSKGMEWGAISFKPTRLACLKGLSGLSEFDSVVK